MSAVLAVRAEQLYVGSGNWATFQTADALLERRMVSGQDDTRIEVIVYRTPNGLRTSVPMKDSERTFEWVDKTAIVAVEGQRIEVSA